MATQRICGRACMEANFKFCKEACKQHYQEISPKSDHPPRWTHLSNRELWEKILEEDQEAKSEVVHRFDSSVRAICRRFECYSLNLEDLRNQAWQAIFMALPKFEWRSSLPSYIYATTHYSCLDLMRREVKWRHLHLMEGETYLRGFEDERLSIIELAQSGDAGVQDRVFTLVSNEAVVRAIQSLKSGDERTAILLSCVSGLTHAEISERTGWKIDKIKNLLRSGKSKLDRTLRDSESR